MIKGSHLCLGYMLDVFEKELIKNKIETTFYRHIYSVLTIQSQNIPIVQCLLSFGHFLFINIILIWLEICIVTLHTKQAAAKVVRHYIDLKTLQQ